MSDLADSELLELLKRGDATAMQDMFRRYHQMLCGFAYNVTRDKDQAKDVVQEVFIKLWRIRTDVFIHTSLKSYLVRATINTALNAVKNKNVSLDEASGSASSDPNAEGEIFYHELKTAADIAVNNLPERTRKVFLLIRTEELTYREVADELQISTKAVEKEMMKALRMLREQLSRYLRNPLIFIAVAPFL